MKRLLFIALITSTHQLNAQSLPNLIATAHYSYNGSGFSINDSVHYYYSGGRTGQLSGTKQFDSTINWQHSGAPVLFSIQKQTFDANNNIIQLLYQRWSGLLWQNATLVLNSYNSANQVIETKRCMWNVSKWDSTTKMLHTYTNGKKVETIAQKWDAASMAWENDRLDSFIYDGGGNLIRSVIYTWNAPGWSVHEQSEYTYDTNNNILTYISSDWDYTLSVWKPGLKLFYGYNTSNENTEYTMQAWDAGIPGWRNVSKMLFTYNAAHNPVTETAQQWDGSNGRFNNFTQVTHTYNSNNQEVMESSRSWEVPANTWVINAMCDEYHYYYATPAAISANNLQAVVNIFPVPAADMLHLNLSMDKQEDVTIQVTGIDGRTYWSRERKNMKDLKEIIDTQSLPGGNYTLSITSGDGAIYRQFSIVH